MHQPLNLEQNLLFGKIVAENCMKMKEIGHGEERVPESTNGHRSL